MGKIKLLLQRYREGIGLGGLATVALIALWFVSLACVDIFDYFWLNTQVDVKVERWGVVQLGDDQFAVEATYAYEVAGVHYTATSPIPDIVYRNAFAAEPHIKEFEGKTLVAWYHGDYPETTVLYKSFPIKKVVYAFILTIVFLYFIYIKRFLK